MSDAPLMLSVSGLRGLVGRSLTPPVAARYAAAFGNWLRARHADKSGALHVVLGRDSRPSGQMIESAAVSGLVAAGCRVTQLGIASTPGVAIMTQHLGAQGGMVITASHNPIQWNGIKVFRHDGVAPPADQVRDIIDRFHADRADYAGVKNDAPLTQDDSTPRVHTELLLRHLDVAAIRKRKLKVVLDSMHGAGGAETAALLEALGVELIHLYAEPTGQFPHHPEPTRENVVSLCQAVREHGGDIGFTQDPDADRLAVVDETGSYIGEEYTLALACLHVLERCAAESAGATVKVAANLSTSRMIDDIAAPFGAQVVRTAVGEANVADAMRACGAVMGGEGNGGVIWPVASHVRDSLAGIALILEMLAQRDQTLSHIIDRIPRYTMVKDKLDLQPGLADGLAKTLGEHFADQKIDMRDGVRIDWPDRWVHVRPSNTEPIVRLIAEADDEPAARELIQMVRDRLGLAV